MLARTPARIESRDFNPSHSQLRDRVKSGLAHASFAQSEYMIEGVNAKGGDNPRDARRLVESKPDRNHDETCHMGDDEDIVCLSAPERRGKYDDQVDTEEGYESINGGWGRDLLLEISRNGPLVD